jgi:hypothetical protein
MSDDADLTIGEYVRFLFGGTSEESCPQWPPDAFAAAGALLQRSGAYRCVLTKWPPNHDPAWNDRMFQIGADWRHTGGSNDDAPDEPRVWWETIMANERLPVDALDDRIDLAHVLLQLTAAADEASADAGLYLGPEDEFSRSAHNRLRTTKGRTLCKDVHPSRAVVLPKLHTPQSGLTMRSMTHHLALYLGGQIRPRWHVTPTTTELRKLLILPWPLTIDPAHFKLSAGEPANMPDCYGYFAYDVSADSRGFSLDDVRNAILIAERQVGNIDGVVFPELSLRGDDYLVLAEKTGKMIIAGVGKQASSTELAVNFAAVAVPTTFDLPVSWRQSKHHRWRLDKGQIEQYDLTDGFPDPSKLWWEHIALDERELHFLTLTNSVTMTVLICEDLARLDPVNELIATVGPTFVVALLMDGPQLPSRWPGRYATVLADDPGASVLSVTSLGMARRYKHPTFGSSSVFALWRDAKSDRGVVPISMQDDSLGVVLSVSSKQFPEWTADGRNDWNETFYLILDGPPEEIRP